MQERELRLEVAYNVRHLGGYRTQDDRTTNEDLIRSASLHRLTDTALAELRDRGVRTIVDFRSEAERERDVTPDLAPFGIRKVLAPVWDKDASPPGMANEFPGYAAVYPLFLEAGVFAYRTLFETIADTDGLLIFHCAAGKDRTGVAAALLLEVAGVSDDRILEDYALSAMLLTPVLKEWLPRMSERGISEDHALRLMASEASDMASTLQVIRERWGSAEGYLRESGVSESVLTATRARILA
ncbi:MAG TPA: tyrosine-protein phosphatase [Tepidiformaceae bacterium]|nr:tyrosine-protein phosphatase [Tepidiformaceae bacterium]